MPKAARFKVQTRLNDGLVDAPPVEYDVTDERQLVAILLSDDVFTNDYGVLVPVGATVEITRIA